MAVAFPLRLAGLAGLAEPALGQLRALGRSSPHPAGRPRALRVCGSRLGRECRLLTPRPLPPGPSLSCSFAASGLASRPDGVAGVHGLAGGGERSPALQLVSCTHYLPRPAVAPKPPALWSIVALEDNTHVMYVHSPPAAPHSAQWAMQTFLHPHFVLPSNQALLKSLGSETPKRVTRCYISAKHDHCRGMSPGEMIDVPASP